MKMIRCKKCGTMIASEDTIIERIMDEAREERKILENELKKAKELVEKGNSMVCQGNALVSKGNSMISKGKTLVSEGNKMSSSANIHRDNAKQLDKLATQIMHMTTQLGVRKGEKEKEKSVLVQYLLENNLITKEKLNELDEKAREENRIIIEQEERELDLLYKSYSDYTGNKTKADPTYKKANKQL